MKVYLDTNIILDWFRNIMIGARKVKEFKTPKKMEFLKLQGIELFVSDLSKIEILRYLKSDWNADKETIEEIWQRFLESFNVNYLVIQNLDFKELSEICLLIPTRKKTLINLMHLQIAKKEDIWFLTGEKGLLTKYKNYYEKSISYPELRKLFLS